MENADAQHDLSEELEDEHIETEGTYNHERGNQRDLPRDISTSTSDQDKIKRKGPNTVSSVSGTHGEETDGDNEFEGLDITSKDDGDEEEEEKEEEEEDYSSDDAEEAKDGDLNRSQSGDSSASSVLSSPKDDRAALRKMMAEEQKTVAASLSQTVKADIEKGRAVKRQRSTFDALLNTRIKLQKALISTNTMSSSTSSDISVDHAETIRAAETAALNLWTSLNDLRSSLHKPKNPKKRPLVATLSTTSQDIWSEMQFHETHFIPHRRTTLTKWSQKTNPASALPRQNKFSLAPTQQSLTTVLDQQLSGSSLDRLIARTKIPRSCAPAQASQRLASDENIYDDADFYTLLLRELVDQRMASTSLGATSTTLNGDGAIPALPSQRDLKIKKQVDTKASKGRKMRYTVHEKLQDFMAPDDRGSWGDRQREELFAGLLGRRVRLDEHEGEGDEGVEMEVDGGEGGDLRLFG